MINGLVNLKTFQGGKKFGYQSGITTNSFATFPLLHLLPLPCQKQIGQLAKASGDSIIGAGIKDRNMFVIDRGLTDYKDKVVIA